MAGRIAKQVIPDGVEYWPNCDLCPKLCDNSASVCMEGEGASTASIMIVGAFPREADDELNRPFVSPMGQSLRDDILVAAGIPESEIRFTHAVRCRALENKSPSALEIRRCHIFLEAEIKRVRPKVIVAMGDTALASMMQLYYKGEVEEGAAKKQGSKLAGIGRWQGKLVWLREFDCWLVPSYSLESCVDKRGRFSNYQLGLVVNTFKLAWEHARNVRPAFPYPVSLTVTDPTKIIAVLGKMKRMKAFAFDIETGGVGRASGKFIIGFSLSCDSELGYYIPWNCLIQSKLAFSLFKEVITDKDCYKIMHNGAYEARILAVVYGIHINTIKYFDTMVCAHLVDENFSKRLKDLAWLYTSFGGYDIPLEKYKQEHKIKEDYSLIPDDILRLYGAFDAIATWIIYTKLKPKMAEDQVTSLFEKVLMPVRRVMNDAEYNGMRVDLDRATRVNELCGQAVLKLEEKIYACAGRKFNIGSSKQLQDLLFKDMRFTPLKETKTGYSVDSASIEYVATQPNSELATYLLDRSYVSTMRGTHISQAIAFTWPDDGRVHTNYNLTGTVTGRCSCLVAGTMVPTNRGTLPIEEVLPGDFVVSHLGNARKVIKVIDQGVSPVYRLTTEMFRHILCTRDHRLYTPDGWVEAQYAKEIFSVSVKSVDERFRVLVEQHGGQSCDMHFGGSSQFASKVESVTSFSYVGEVQVYDLVVDIDESFVANGFLVHNCSQPSLQNVPADSMIRSLYISSNKCLLVEADLKSAEMATIAAISGEQTFLKAFAEGLDIHSETYRKMYDLPPDYICSKLERRKAKAINFGLVYGMTAIGLAKRLSMTVEEATDFMELYFVRLPKVARWMEMQRAKVRDTGYVVSVFGRKRRLPLGMSDQWGDIGRAERQAMNSPIQSGAADYTYVGLVRLRQAILKARLHAKIVHTVHDCVVVDTPEEEVACVTDLIHEAFESPVSVMPVRMKVDVEVNQRWGQNNESRLQTIFDTVGLKLVS